MIILKTGIEILGIFIDTVVSYADLKKSGFILNYTFNNDY